MTHYTMYNVVPGHKGVVVGDRKYMIERAVRQSLHRVHTKKQWDPRSLSTITKYYLPNGELYNAMIHGPYILIEEKSM
jgi:hypothetical protein